MSTANEAIVGPMSMDTILSETDFELFGSGAATALRGGGGFYGAIEGTPHNYIHGFVGGTMGSYMSPLDPVFWTHHNVIDYFWLAWNQRVVDGEGNPVTYRVGALILAPLLSYRFEPPAPCGVLRFTTLETSALRRFLEQGAAVRFRIDREFQPGEGARLSVAEQSRVRVPIAAEPLRAASAAMSEQRLVLQLSNVEAPVENDFYVQVYLNLPDGEQASIESEFYAGSFAFFTDRSMQGMRYNYVVDLSDAIARLRETGRLQPEGDTSITLVAAPVETGGAARGTVSIGALTPAMIPRSPPAVPLQ
jgi:tyrosinase